MISEDKLVYLYKKCINFTIDEASSYLEDLYVDELSTDEIVHMLNALSPRKKDIKGWGNFVEMCKKRLIFLEGKESSEDLMIVIL
jgi:hypothetical protein